MKKLAGIPASPGIVMGKAFVHLEKTIPKIIRYRIKESQVEHELVRFANACEAAAAEVRSLHERALLEMGKAQADIFAAHLMMLEDVDIQEQIAQRLKENYENIEWVVYDTASLLADKMLQSPDPSFRERATDITDVSNRILGQLLSINKNSLAELDTDVILVTHDLLPSQVLTMNRAHVKGIVMDSGGLTSHTAILARAFNIPAVLGVASATYEISNGDMLVVNATAGDVIISPSEKELDKLQRTEAKYYKTQKEHLKNSELPTETTDGYKVSIKANIEIPEEAHKALRSGAEGIGLYRSEFLFLNPDEAAGEAEQIRAYSHVIKTMRNLPVTIRTVDIGGDKILPEFHAASETNPLLGWRAIRFSLSMPDFFKTQLRSILRASKNGNVRIMFPLISGIEELDAALSLLKEAKDECRKKNYEFTENIETGIMIEVPSAAITADILAQKADFFSIGTNDLIQYTLAVDRGNEKVGYLAHPAHPAILRFLKNTIDAAHSRGIKSAMCGEMAGDPGMTALLLGLGLDEFSMASLSIPLVKRVVRSLSIAACRELAGELLKGTSAVANNAVLKTWMAENFPK